MRNLVLRLATSVATLPLLASIFLGAQPVLADDPIPAAIRFSPPCQTWPVDTTQTVDVLLDTGSYVISSATIKLNYSPNMQYLGYSSNGAVLEQGAAPVSDHFSSLTFSRSSRGGFIGNNGLLVHLQFKALDENTKYINLDLAMSSLYAFNFSEDENAQPFINVINKISPAFYSVQGPLNLPPLPERTVAPRTTATIVQTYQPNQPAQLVSLRVPAVEPAPKRAWLTYLLWTVGILGLVLVVFYILNLRRPIVTIRTLQ